MDRVDKIYNHHKFKEIMSKITDVENGRIYCLHGVEHSFDVARIAYIMSLEKGFNIKKDVIYACALLHDLGRGVNYHNHTPKSVELSDEILRDCDFGENEILQIKNAINVHGDENGNGLLGIIQRADKLSRLCFNCKSIDTCKWKREELNMNITY